MSHRDTKSHNCHCWIAVLCALLIVISMADFGLAVVLGSFADIVFDLNNQVTAQQTGMSIANFFSNITGGLLHLGDSQAGKAIREISKELPPHWMMASLAWGRVLISLLGFILGWAFIWFRPRFLVWVLIVWGLISAIWGLLSVSEAWLIFEALVIEELMLVGVVLTLLALGLHLIWPLYVSIRLFVGFLRGDFSRQ